MTGKADFFRGLLLMSEWNEDELRRAIEDLCQESDGANWPAVANRISRTMPWEWDDEFDERLDEAADDGHP
jgi:hypothetical protein